MKTSEIIRKSKEAFFTHGWTKGDVRDVNGKVCLVGAVYMGTQGELVPYMMGTGDAMNDCNPEAMTSLASALTEIGTDGDVCAWDDLVLYNDSPEIDFNDICDLFDRAEKIAERNEDESI